MCSHPTKEPVTMPMMPTKPQVYFSHPSFGLVTRSELDVLEDHSVGRESLRGVMMRQVSNKQFGRLRDVRKGRAVKRSL